MFALHQQSADEVSSYKTVSARNRYLQILRLALSSIARIIGYNTRGGSRFPFVRVVQTTIPIAKPADHQLC